MMPPRCIMLTIRTRETASPTDDGADCDGTSGYTTTTSCGWPAAPATENGSSSAAAHATKQERIQLNTKFFFAATGAFPGPEPLG